MSFLSRLLVGCYPFHASMPKRAVMDSPIARFALKDGASLILQRGDLTKAKVDAIVNAANPRMLGGGGVDGAIHRAAGPELRMACLEVEEVAPNVRCPVGEARITPGFRLPASYVIHTVGPIFESTSESAPLLFRSYRSCLDLANKHGLKTIAFPAISCGVYGYPYREAAGIAVAACEDHGAKLEEIRFVLFEQPAWDAWLAAAQEQLGEESGRGEQGGDAQPAAQAEEGAVAAEEGGATEQEGKGVLPAVQGDEVASRQMPETGTQEGATSPDAMAGVAAVGDTEGDVAAPGQAAPMETDASQQSQVSIDPVAAACAGPADADICTSQGDAGVGAAGTEVSQGLSGQDAPAGERRAGHGSMPVDAANADGRDDVDKKRKHEGSAGVDNLL
eukprot:jgi/Mesvir1/9442/Mv09839-RA.1